MFEFKRGVIIQSDYEKGSLSHVTEHLIIRTEDGSEYEVNWAIFHDQDLFGEGDRVSILLQDGLVKHIK